MNEQEFAELAAGHALNALSPDDERALERALAAHPEWSHHLDEAAQDVVLLADTVPAVAPPPHIREALLAQISDSVRGDTMPRADREATGETVPQAPAGPDPDVATAAGPDVRPAGGDVAGPPTTETIAITRRRWTRGLFALAASFVLLVAIGFGAASINEHLNRTPAQIALAEIEGAPDAASITAEAADGGVVTAWWSPSLDRAVVVTDGLPALADDQVFELWIIRDGEASSAGTFAAAPGGETITLIDDGVEQGDTIAMTVEPDGGSPTGQPTSDPLVAISTDASA